MVNILPPAPLREIIRTAEAAAMLGMAPLTFRRRFCGHSHPALPIIESRGPRGGRRIFLRRTDVEALIESMTVKPRGGLE